MGPLPTRFLAGKVDTRSGMDLLQLRVRYRYGKVLDGGRLYRQIFARGTDKCAAPHSIPSIEKMMGLCSASHSRAEVDLKGLSHPISLHAYSELPPATLVLEAQSSMYPGHSYFLRSSGKHPHED